MKFAVLVIAILLLSSPLLAGSASKNKARRKLRSKHDSHPAVEERIISLAKRHETASCRPNRNPCKAGLRFGKIMALSTARFVAYEGHTEESGVATFNAWLEKSESKLVDNKWVLKGFNDNYPAYYKKQHAKIGNFCKRTTTEVKKEETKNPAIDPITKWKEVPNPREVRNVEKINEAIKELEKTKEPAVVEEIKARIETCKERIREEKVHKLCAKVRFLKEKWRIAQGPEKEEVKHQIIVCRKQIRKKSCLLKNLFNRISRCKKRAEEAKTPEVKKENEREVERIEVQVLHKECLKAKKEVKQAKTPEDKKKWREHVKKARINFCQKEIHVRKVTKERLVELLALVKKLKDELTKAPEADKKRLTEEIERARDEINRHRRWLRRYAIKLRRHRRNRILRLRRRIRKLARQIFKLNKQLLGSTDPKNPAEVAKIDALEKVKKTLEDRLKAYIIKQRERTIKRLERLIVRLEGILKKLTDPKTKAKIERRLRKAKRALQRAKGVKTLLNVLEEILKTLEGKSDKETDPAKKGVLNQKIRKLKLLIAIRKRSLLYKERKQAQPDAKKPIQEKINLINKEIAQLRKEISEYNKKTTVELNKEIETLPKELTVTTDPVKALLLRRRIRCIRRRIRRDRWRRIVRRRRRVRRCVRKIHKVEEKIEKVEEKIAEAKKPEEIAEAKKILEELQAKKEKCHKVFVKVEEKVIEAIKPTECGEVRPPPLPEVITGVPPKKKGSKIEIPKGCDCCGPIVKTLRGRIHRLRKQIKLLKAQQAGVQSVAKASTLQKLLV